MRCWSPASSWARSTTRGPGPQTRHWLLDKIAGDDELHRSTSYDLSRQLGQRSRLTSAPHRRDERRTRELDASRPDPRSGSGRSPAGQGPLQRTGHEPARARDVGHLRAGPRRRAERRRGAAARPRRSTVHPAGGEGHVLGALPRDEVRVRRDHAVVAERAAAPPGGSRNGGDGQTAVRVAALAHEPEHVAGLDAPALDGERRVRGEMRVVELVPARGRAARAASRRSRSSRPCARCRPRPRGAASRAARRCPRRDASR